MIIHKKLDENLKHYIFLDISETFRTVTHSKVLLKTEGLRVGCEVLEWFLSYLLNWRRLS